MKTALLRFLICPYCGSGLRLSSRSPAAGDDVESGLLACDCGEIPVLGGIPIFRREGSVDTMMQTVDGPLSRGPEVRRLIDLIRSGAADTALLLLLVPPGPSVRRAFDLAELLPERLRSGLRRRAIRSWSRRGRADAELFLGDGGRTTAVDAFHYYYRRSRRSELYNYFTYRFGQPRHLAALSLASLLPEPAGPTLDLACGFGHLLHHGTVSRPGGSFIGLDRNFFQLYAAKRWVAPRAEYVCADADLKLPFATGSFGAVLCSDAFHYFLRRLLSAEEIQRVVEERGVVVLSRVGNANAEPREGYELTPEGYSRLFAKLPCRVIGETALLDRYLEGLGPDLSQPVSPADLAGQKWVSLVASRRDGVFRDHGRMGSWPHGFGKLSINPLYRERRQDPRGNATYDLTFPSKWYELENGDCRRYMPSSVTVTRSALEAVEEGTLTEETEALLRQCVALGLPDRYI